MVHIIIVKLVLMIWVTLASACSPEAADNGNMWTRMRLPRFRTWTTFREAAAGCPARSVSVFRPLHQHGRGLCPGNPPQRSRPGDDRLSGAGYAVRGLLSDSKQPRAGFEEVAYNTDTGAVRAALSSRDSYTAEARLRVEQPASVSGVGAYRVAGFTA